MKKEFFNHLANLYYLAPRFWENEKKTANYIKRVLSLKGISFMVQNYDVSYPYWEEYYLKVDDLFLEVLPSGFKTGYFKNNFLLHDSSGLEPVYENFVISYNSKSESISTPVIYPNVGLAIKKNDVDLIKQAKNVEGYLKVSSYDFIGENIIVGNVESPKKILICHYDSFWGGSLDNGTGTSLLLTLVDKIKLNDYLILFAGSEEISMDDYDKYWCYGYRQFEKKYLSVMDKAKEILIFDSFGYNTNTVITDKSVLSEAFLIENKYLLDKVKMYASEFDDILKNYHTPDDRPDKINNLSFDEILSFIED